MFATKEMKIDIFSIISHVLHGLFRNLNINNFIMWFITKENFQNSIIFDVSKDTYSRTNKSCMRVLISAMMTRIVLE